MMAARTSRTRIESAERRGRALELRKAGATFEQIANQLGYADRHSAREAVVRALKDITRDGAEEVLDLELQRLDAMLVGLWAAARRGEPRSVETVLKVMERRSKYLGLDDYESRMAHVAEEQIRITEQQAETVIALLQAVLGQLGLTQEQEERAPQVIIGEMRRLALVTGTEKITELPPESEQVAF